MRFVDVHGRLGIDVGLCIAMNVSLSVPWVCCYVEVAVLNKV